MSKQLSTRSRLKLLAVPVLFGGVLVGCGDDAEPAQPVTIDETETDDLATPQLGGLEVTVTGNVTEIIDDQSFQIDKDGLGDAGDVSDRVGVEDDYFDDGFEIYDDYDGEYDYYDYEYYTWWDEEWDEFDERGVLVVTPAGSTVTVGDAVQVNATLRYYEQSTLETIYDVDFDDELYGSYENQYVIIADGVKSVPAQQGEGASSDSGSSSTTAMADGSSTSTSSTTTAGGGSTTSSSSPATSEPEG